MSVRSQRSQNQSVVIEAEDEVAQVVDQGADESRHAFDEVMQQYEYSENQYELFLQHLMSDREFQLALNNYRKKQELKEIDF